MFASALQHGPTRFAGAVSGSLLALSAGLAGANWAGPAAPLTVAEQLSAAGSPAPVAQESRQPGTRLTRVADHPAAGFPLLDLTSHVAHPLLLAARPAAGQPLRPAHRHRSPRPRLASLHAPAYRNPFRDVSGLLPERIDMGVDFGGAGPVYALGDAVITNATGDSPGWPGGGWITYRLTDGPDAGLMVFLAEDVTPTVQVGQHVSASTVIATMFAGPDGIETGWAQPDGFSAESQLPEAGAISGGGPFPTMIGLNFEEMLQSLGVPAGNNRSDPAFGILPANYPAIWK